MESIAETGSAPGVAVGTCGYSLGADTFSLEAIASCIVESTRGTVSAAGAVVGTYVESVTKTGSTPGAAVGTCGYSLGADTFSLVVSPKDIVTGADRADELSLVNTDVGR
jgi:hypothetical protein